MLNLTIEKIRKRITERLSPDVHKISAVSFMGGNLDNNLKPGLAIKLKTTLMRFEGVRRVKAWLSRTKSAPARIQRCEEKINVMISQISRIESENYHLNSLIVALHEKTDSYTKTLYGKMEAYRPLLYAGQNCMVKRIDDCIMAFPAEDIKLAVSLAADSLEPGLIMAMRKAIKSGMTVVDVGAHIGLISVVAAKQVGKTGTVHCFEPTPRTFDILKTNVSLNDLEGTVVLNQMAVTDKKGIVALGLYEIYGHNTIFPDGDSKTVIEVESESLDNYFDSNTKVDVVKIDAEGAEPIVLKGMQKIISDNPEIKIFIEFAPSHLNRARITCLDFINQIKSYGFSYKKVEDPSGNFTSISNEELYNSISVNLVLGRKL